MWRAGFSLVVACGFSLSSCGTWAPERMGSVVCGMRALSVVVVCGLSCPATCGILVPQPGIEPMSTALEGGFFTTGLILIMVESFHFILSSTGKH